MYSEQIERVLKAVKADNKQEAVRLLTIALKCAEAEDKLELARKTELKHF